MKDYLSFLFWILNLIPEGVIFLNEKEEIIFFNKSAKKFFNLDPSFFGKKFDQLRGIQKNQEKEIKISEDLILKVVFFPVGGKEKKIATVILFFDVTREKRLENIRRELLTIITHQLRGPISTMKWNLEFFLKEKLGPLNETQKNFLKELLKTQNHLLAILDDLLRLAKIEEGRILERVHLFSLESIIDYVISLFELEIQKKKISFEIKKPSFSLPQVKMDAEKIKIAVENLVDNAIKYSKEGGRIVISLNLLEKEILFSIKDEGIGISDSEKAKIFTKFFRGEKAKELFSEGSGLGLFIVKGIIEAHGGRVWFESEKDKGSTFYFTLPLIS